MPTPELPAIRGSTFHHYLYQSVLMDSPFIFENPVAAGKT